MLEEKNLVKEYPFPNDLEGRLNAVLNVVNNPFKMLSLFTLDRQYPKTYSEIHTGVKNIIRENVRIPLLGSFESYLDLTLVPIGLVAKEEFTSYSQDYFSIGYCLTEAGQKYLPVIAFSLEYMAENNLDFFKIFGSTQSRGSIRAPLLRTKILKGLIKLGEVKETGLSKYLRINSDITSPIKSLKNQGFINFESIGESKRGKPCCFYEVTKKVYEDSIDIENRPKLTKTLVDYIKNKENINAIQVSQDLEIHKSYACVMLNSLVDKGFLNRIGFEKNKNTKISITKKGEKLVDYLTFIGDALMDGENLDLMRNCCYNEFICNPSKLEEYASKVCISHSKSSRYMNKESSEEKIEKIIKYLRENPGERFNRLAESFSPTFLSRIVKSGKVRKEKLGREARYYLNE